MNNEIEIIEYQDKYKNILHELTIEWLGKNFIIVPEDMKFLNDPKGVVIDKGGHIFFAKMKDEIIGTVSLIRKSDKIYELAKLAVTEKAKGMGVGKKLMDKCIEVAVESKFDKIILFTNTKLMPAIQLYLKYGFIEMKPEKNKYAESDLYMELCMK